MDLVAPALAVLVGITAGIGLGWLIAAAHPRTGRAALAAAQAAADTARDELERQREAQRLLADRAEAEAVARDARSAREQTLLRALAPMRESLMTMQDAVTRLERDRERQYGSLSEQLRRAQESDESLRATTENLVGALRTGSTRGVWGETQLRRVVEAAGLVRHVDFDLQATVVSDAGAGRPDLIVRLPGARGIAVDAKAPFDAFLEATAGGELDDGARAELLRRHAKALRGHVDALAKKAYWAGLSDSPELVVCFLPAESLLSAALDADPGLLDHAFARRVALVTPVSLWALLKTVAHSWAQQELGVEARRLVELGRELHDRLGTLAGHAEELRKGLERSVEGYNRFVGALESRVLVTARRFPGIDESRLAALDAPAVIERGLRPFTAPELTTPELTAPLPTGTDALAADLGDVRDRIG